MTERSSTVPVHRAADDLREHADGLYLLYQQWASALALSVAACALWVWIMWDDVDRSSLLFWAGGILLAILVRTGLFVRYRMTKPVGEQLLRWELPFCLTLLPGALIWGIGCPLILANESLQNQLITYLFLFGLSGMAISTYGILPRFTIVMIAILVLPMPVFWLLQGDSPQKWLAAGGVLYLLATAKGITRHASSVYESYRLRHQLQDAYQISDHHANTDSLTGIRNRRAFFAACDLLLSSRTESVAPSSMLLLDLDDFKKINDELGHAVGDQALRHIASLLQACCRSSDPCGRLGGDEFALFLHQTPLKQALALAEKLRQSVVSHPLQLADRSVPIGISIGLAAHANEIEELMLGADSALYEAKRQGKNQIALHSSGRNTEPTSASVRRRAL